MFKSNRSFMSISKQGTELCSQLVIYNIRTLEILDIAIRTWVQGGTTYEDENCFIG